MVRCRGKGKSCKSRQNIDKISIGRHIEQTTKLTIHVDDLYEKMYAEYSKSSVSATASPSAKHSGHVIEFYFY